MIYVERINKEDYQSIANGMTTYELTRKKAKTNDVVMFINENDNNMLNVKIKGVSNNIITFDTPYEEVRIFDELDCDDHSLKYVVIIAVYNGKVVFCKHKNRNTIELPGGHIEENETSLQAAKRELYEETGIEKAEFYSGNYYYARRINSDSKGAYARIFIADVKELPNAMPDFEMESVSLMDILPQKEKYIYTTSEIPLDLSHFEIYISILFNFQFELQYYDSSGENGPLEISDIFNLCDASVNFDYINFDPDEYFHQVVLSDDCEDYVTPLENVSATEENYSRIRESLLYSIDMIEYFELLVEKFGVKRVRSDDKLISHIYETFDQEVIDKILIDSI